jgi:hypothetical protein
LPAGELLAAVVERSVMLVGTGMASPHGRPDGALRHRPSLAVA